MKTFNFIHRRWLATVRGSFSGGVSVVIFCIALMLFSEASMAKGDPSGKTLVSSSSELNASISNATCENKVIVILPGVYTPTQTLVPADPDPRNKTFAIKYNMTLIGFGPLTKLSGEIGNPSIATDNIRHIVTIDHLSNVNLALMTIQRGYDDRAFVAGQTQGFGAGVLALFSTVKLDGVILRDNLAYAGALSGKGTDVLVKNSLFENNTAINTGGTINVDDNDTLNPGVGSLSVSNSIFKNNKSSGTGFGEGGAIVVWRLNANIRDSYFSNNSTNNTIFALGGGSKSG